MTLVASLFAQTHEAPPAHLLIVAVLAVAALVGWLLYRVSRRRADERPSTTARDRTDLADATREGEDRA